ncbi:hypothetical protein TrVE_jg4375 [Triparma verrucosa]|uniref:HIRAN domain-containing protein n=1 Tax=Triparma verrucosa TaxID=1606542 RepID=A0A9W7KSG9_9STRA|nr:hypothetical protein TrVE_jg4375 [Triparma verrucosa]
MFAALKRMLTRDSRASNATADQSNNNRAVVKTEPVDESMDGTSEGPPKWYGAAVPRARKVKSTKEAEGKRKKVAKKKTVAAKKTKVEKKPAPKKSKKSTKKVKKKKKKKEEEEEEETPGLIVKIAGTSFRNSNCVKAIKKNGEVLADDRYTTNHTADLVSDPENPYDPYAIKVLLSGEFVGFIPKDSTHLVDVTLEATVWQFRKNDYLGQFQGKLMVNVGPKQHYNESAEKRGGYEERKFR